MLATPETRSRGKALSVVLLALLCVLASTRHASHVRAASGRATARPAQGPDCAAAGAPAADVVAASNGTFRGVQGEGSIAFRGIPFAAPPVGALRWRPPAPPVCQPGITAATAFGPPCLQLRGTLVDGSEDCLTLNLWVPTAATAGAALPVMFFIYGGGNAVGETNTPLYDGERLAARGNVIVVTANYRLGPFGFLVLPALGAESPSGSSGNYGSLDQIAALQWVHNNIAAFGGDPARVLLFGESAGGRDVCALLASPLAAGLFSRALIESGGCDDPSLAILESYDAPFIAGAGCTDATDLIGCLRALSPETVLRALPAPALISSIARGGDPYYGPNIDGYLLTGSPREVIQAGRHNHVPVVVGANAAETNIAVSLELRTEAAYDAAVAAQYGADAAAILLAAYPSSDFPTVRDALVALTTDVNFVCPSRTTARVLVAGQQEPVFRYVFSEGLQAGPLDLFGAFHGSELFYVFDPLQPSASMPAGAVDQAVSEAMMAYWSSFAATGDPNTANTAVWPQYEVATDPYLNLQEPTMAGYGYRTARCDAVDSAGVGGH